MSNKLDLGLREVGGGNAKMLEEVKQYLNCPLRIANPDLTF